MDIEETLKLHQLKVGQVLFSLNVGDAARRGREQKLTPVTVCKVGRKYFYTGEPSYEYRWCKFNLDDLREVSDFPSQRLYLTEQAWLDEQEARMLRDRIRQTFDGDYDRPRHSLETLRAIVELLPPR